MRLTTADYRALIDRARNEDRLTLVEWEALDTLIRYAAGDVQEAEKP